MHTGNKTYTCLFLKKTKLVYKQIGAALKSFKYMQSLHIFKSLELHSKDFNTVRQADQCFTAALSNLTCHLLTYPFDSMLFVTYFRWYFDIFLQLVEQMSIA